MQHRIVRYPVQNPVLRKYINFFWELRVESIKLNHRLIPQRNINMRLNLSDTPHYMCRDNKLHCLENAYFPGLQNKFLNSHLVINGKVDVLGISFAPFGVYPFLKIPATEFRNHILGTDEIGLRSISKICEQLKDTPDTSTRLLLLEKKLLSLLDDHYVIPENFSHIFKDLTSCPGQLNLTDFCSRYGISIRQMERMFIRYVGLSASTYNTLNRFHVSLNRMLNKEYSRLSDLEYDNEYFDQMHYIKEFRRFAGDTPKNFVKNNNSLLQIGKIE
jgi:AraC-like DNA-binding protein